MLRNHSCSRKSKHQQQQQQSDFHLILQGNEWFPFKLYKEMLRFPFKTPQKREAAHLQARELGVATADEPLHVLRADVQIKQRVRGLAAGLREWFWADFSPLFLLP